MPNIQIVSDLHLEAPKAYDIFQIVPKAPYLALLGDIGNVVTHKEETLGFIKTQLHQFRAVLFVPGNHEAYGADWDTTLQVLRDFEQDIKDRRQRSENNVLDLGQFVLLDRAVFEIPCMSADQPVAILGCSLFSQIPRASEMVVEMGLQDFFQTTSWTTRTHNEAHARDLTWLNEQVQLLQRRNVRIAIFTHWSPTTDSRATDPRHIGSAISSGFSTDLSNEPCFSSGQVSLWAFGHTHFNCDFTLDRKGATPLRLMTNQRGYYFAQANGFNVEKVIEL